MAASMPFTGRSAKRCCRNLPPGHPKGVELHKLLVRKRTALNQHRALRQKRGISRGRLAGIPASKGRWRQKRAHALLSVGRSNSSARKRLKASDSNQPIQDAGGRKRSEISSAQRPKRAITRHAGFSMYLRTFASGASFTVATDSVGQGALSRGRTLRQTEFPPAGRHCANQARPRR